VAIAKKLSAIAARRFCGENAFGKSAIDNKEGRCGTMTHHYKRNGTAMSMLGHRNREFLRLLRRLTPECPDAKVKA
jgi:hypothetical protein